MGEREAFAAWDTGRTFKPTLEECFGAGYRAGIEVAAAKLDELLAAGKHLDEMLLRFAFDAGAIGDEVVSGLGVDPWGTLADFRKAFGLAPTMSPEEWTARALADQSRAEGE